MKVKELIEKLQERVSYREKDVYVKLPRAWDNEEPGDTLEDVIGIKYDENFIVIMPCGNDLY